jgi:protein O-mannosyl-transferase
MKSKKLKIAIILCLVLTVTFIAFYPSLQNDFTNWDDNGHIIDNPAIKTLSWDSVNKMMGSLLLDNYIPLTGISYMIEYRFFKLNPFIYHATNLFLHLMNCILVFWLIYLISDNILIAFLASLLFGIHPLHVESVAWISERKDVLYSFFCLSAVISYIYYIKKEQTQRYYYFAILLFVLSLLSKPMAISLPLLLFLIDYTLFRKFKKRIITEKIPFIILGVIFGLAVYYSQQTAITHRLILMFPDNILYLSYRMVFYMVKLVMPFNLSCFYPYPVKLNGTLPFIYWIYPVILCGFIYLTFIVLKKVNFDRLIIFGILFFLINILPVLQIVPVGRTIVADRYTYLSYIGFFFLAGKGSFYILKEELHHSILIKRFFIILLVCIVGMLSFLTWQRCLIWKNSIVLWTDVIKKYPSVAIAYNNRGYAYFAENEYEKAIVDFNSATKLDPYDPGSSTNLCLVYWKIGKLELAVKECNKAVALKEDCFEAYNNLGSVYSSMGEQGTAIYFYTKAVSINPNYAPAYNNMSKVYLKSKRYGEAIEAGFKAVFLKPDFVEAYDNLGSIYLFLGKHEKSLYYYKKALEFNPNYGSAHNNLAVIYYYRKEYELAAKHFNRAIELKYKVNPEFSELMKIHLP